MENTLSNYTFQNANEIYSTNIIDNISTMMEGKVSRFQHRIPAIVQSYDDTTNEVVVLIAIKAMTAMRDEEGGYVQIDRPLVKTTLKQPFASNAGIIYYPTAGDTGWLEASDRNTSEYKKSESLLISSESIGFENSQYRFGSFTPDIITPRYTLKSDSKGCLTIQSLDASTRIVLNPIGTIIIDAPLGVVVNGDMKVNGMIQTTGDITSSTISVQDHTHSGVQGGSGNTGVPNR